MIYIIGGVSRAGKSTVCRMLSNKRNLPYLPFDILMSASIDAGNPYNINYKSSSDDTAKNMWGFTSSALTHLARHTDNYLVEGIVFWPGLVRLLPSDFQYKACFMGMCEIDVNSKIEKLRTHLDGPNAWQRELSNKDLKWHLDRIVEISHRLRKDCEQTGMIYIESDSCLEELMSDIDDLFFHE